MHAAMKTIRLAGQHAGFLGLLAGIDLDEIAAAQPRLR